MFHLFFSINNLASSPTKPERTTELAYRRDDSTHKEDMEPNCGRVSSGDEQTVTGSGYGGLKVFH